MKYLHTFNESIRDKMSPVTDEDIIKKMEESDKNHASILSTLIYKKDFDLLNKIINSDINISQEGLDELLSLSCKYGYVDLVKYCIEKGADVHQDENSGQDEMNLLVVASNYDEILNLLVDAGLDPIKTIETAEEYEYFNNTTYYETIIDLIYKFDLEDEFDGIIYNYEEYYKPNM